MVGVKGVVGGRVGGGGGQGHRSGRVGDGEGQGIGSGRVEGGGVKGWDAWGSRDGVEEDKGWGGQGVVGVKEVGGQRW